MKRKVFSSLRFITLVYGAVVLFLGCDAKLISSNPYPIDASTEKSPIDQGLTETSIIQDHTVPPVDSFIGSDLPAGNTITVTPTSISDLLNNPYRGVQSWGVPKSEQPRLNGIPSRSIYVRVYWDAIEPSDGVYDFSRFDTIISKAKAENETFSFRIMGLDETSSRIPGWLASKGCATYDLDDADCWKYHQRLIKAFGDRYDKEKVVEWVDIGSVGGWGEWHMASTGLPMTTEARQKDVIDLYFDAFPSKYKILPIGSPQLVHCVSLGCGIRADGVGGVWSEKPNDGYDMWLAQVPDAWKHAPIVAEAFWDITRFIDYGPGMTTTIDNTIRRHFSYFNWQGADISGFTTDQRNETYRMIRSLGYRFELKSLTYQKSASPGSIITIKTNWENVGNAPSYFDHYFAFRLKKSGSSDYIYATSTSIKGILPGGFSKDLPLDISSSVAKGSYELSIGMITDPSNPTADVELAISGKDSDGWYPMGNIEIQ